MMPAARASKLALAAWAAAFVVVQAYYASPGWPALRWLLPLMLLATATASAVSPRVVAVVAAVTYIFPVLIFWGVGAYTVQYSAIWLAAVLGVVLPDAVRTPWHVPSRWQAALACWGGVVCVAVPIVVLREVDLRWELLTRARLPHEALGGLTYQTTGWILHVGLILVIGILWFDWLCGVTREFFARWIVVPLSCSAVVLAGVCTYQMLVDIQFLNPTVFAVIGRASGTLFDGNPAGALAALWIGGIAVAASSTRRWRWPLTGVLVPLFWAAVWATGSRTALASALLVSLFTVASIFRRLGSTRRMAAAAAVVLVIAVLGAAALQRWQPAVAGPIARMRPSLPTLSVGGLQSFARAMWERDQYGVAAHRMIARYPAVGIGVGTFQQMAPDFAGWLPPDNAQNWFRHQLAEFGVVGSLGWMVFVASLAWWMLRRGSGGAPDGRILFGMLIAFVVVSLVGMPGQDPSVALTLWTFVAWYLMAAGRPPDTASVPRIAWVASAAVVVVFVGATVQLAAGRLRMPVRIQHALSGNATTYSYGFWAAEQDAQGEFRWTGKEATIVVPVTGRVLKLTASVNYGDPALYPTRAKVWVDGKLAIDGDLTASAPALSAEVLLPAGQARVLIETSSGRVVKAPAPDPRELGLMMRWEFLPTSD